MELKEIEQLKQFNKDHLEDFERLLEITKEIGEDIVKIMLDNNINSVCGWSVVEIDHGQWYVSYLASGEDRITGTKEGYYYAGDYNYWVAEQTQKATFQFLNRLEDILNELKSQIKENNNKVNKWLEKLK